MTYTITPIPEFNDNYIWLIGHEQSRSAIIVDPGAADKITNYCKQHNWQPTTIWATHHHQDHIGGVESLVQTWGCKTYGPAASAEQYDCELNDGDKISLFDDKNAVQIIATPGHTKDHICFMSKIGLFCGDTLFAGGCGRAFECEPATLYASLQRLAMLPVDTEVFCAHEYTVNNLLFAQHVEADNRDISNKIATATEKRNKNMPTLPSTIASELATNPFLRCQSAAIIHWAEQTSGQQQLQAAEVFAILRNAKDQW